MTLHYLPIQEGIPNTAHYLKQINEPVILMGDFIYTGEINEFKEIGLYDVDSTYEKNWIDRIFYSKSYFKNIEFGSLIDSLWVSDHSANYGIIKIKD
jgi:endonuclease/exonuclease/phosphatase family metal-dependent hydrolase